eukprot:3788611-Rhodomonas_salina.1
MRAIETHAQALGIAKETGGREEEGTACWNLRTGVADRRRAIEVCPEAPRGLGGDGGRERTRASSVLVQHTRVAWRGLRCIESDQALQAACASFKLSHSLEPSLGPAGMLRGRRSSRLASPSAPRISSTRSRMPGTNCCRNALCSAVGREDLGGAARGMGKAKGLWHVLEGGTCWRVARAGGWHVLEGDATQMHSEAGSRDAKLLARASAGREWERVCQCGAARAGESFAFALWSPASASAGRRPARQAAARGRVRGVGCRHACATTGEERGCTLARLLAALEGSIARSRLRLGSV